MQREQAKHAGALIRRKRMAFTLVEVIVALFLITVGLLALVAASGVAVDQIGDLDRQRRATQFAESRAESLGAQLCLGANSGSVVPELGMSEWWSVGAPTRGVRELVDSIEFPRGRFTGRVVVRTLAPC
jgi:type II secretory pathway pseudopilin PulG